MYGNAFEAFIGAIYLDRGYECCKQFMERRIIEPYIDLDKLSRKEVNFKSKLIEWSQKNKMEVSFELIEQSLDKENNPVFQTEVRIEGILGGSGTGYSKKESQQNAAQMTLKKIKGDPEFMASVQEAKTQNNVPAEDTTPESETSLTAENQQIDEIISTEEIIQTLFIQSRFPSGVPAPQDRVPRSPTSTFRLPPLMQQKISHPLSKQSYDRTVH